jgi:hypothetical protein
MNEHKFQLTISDLKRIISIAEGCMEDDSSLSDTLQFTLVEHCDTHTGSDIVRVDLLSAYSECFGKNII